MRVKDTLKSLGVNPSKGRGQNFLIDETVLDKIIDFGDPDPKETIIEIGPGLGALTERLVKFTNVTVIEIEEEFALTLKRKHPTLKVINKDVRDVDFSELGDELTVYGNLPYSFSSDIVLSLLNARNSIKKAVLLLQKEFAERLSAKPSTKAYGSLSVAIQLWADTELGPSVPGNSFHPPTKVTSQLVALTFRKSPRVKVDDLKWFEKVVRASFAKRRKTLLNSLTGSGIFSKSQTQEALLKAEIDGTRRGETLTIEEFARLAECLKFLK